MSGIVFAQPDCRDAMDCNNENIKELAKKLTMPTQEQTIKKDIIWIGNNIKGDYSIINPKNFIFYFFLKPQVFYKKASDVLNEKKGICSHHSLLLSALAKQQNIKIKTYSACVERGCDTFMCRLSKKITGCTEKHVYNKVLLNNEWVFVDATFGLFNYSTSYKIKGEKECNPYPLKITKGDCIFYDWLW